MLGMGRTVVRGPLRLVTGFAGGWARASNDRAVVMARAACVECSRRAVERAEVALVLAGLEQPTTYAAAE
jgi:hypothetical protein